MNANSVVGSPSDEELLSVLLALTSIHERADYLRGVCDGDISRIEMLLKLVNFVDGSGAFLENGIHDANHLVNDAFERIAGDAPTTTSNLPEGTEIGPFRLMEVAGRGGFGIVYRAVQEVPVRREAAVKLLRPGGNGEEVLRRFDRERETLARLRHPGIAAFYDAGSTREGLPWIAMELVNGVPINRYCRDHESSIRQRLLLFQKVCQAVHHAHLRGIIHRDLKPSNVLVTGTEEGPEPKVIDFGIARCLEFEIEGQSFVTRAGQFMGTPAYMSPEQAGLLKREVDVRSDVYALGAILYELLTGDMPFGDAFRSEQNPLMVAKLIEETEPERPSSRISSGPSPRAGLESKKDTANLLKGDLDWIVLKALSKDPDRRYDSASAFAGDIQAHLERRPVVARPPSFLYLAGRFCQRKRAVVVSGAVALVAICAALVFSTLMYFSERDARLASVLDQQRSDQVSGILTEALSAAGPSKALGRDASMMRDILEATSERLASSDDILPEVESELRRTLGNTFRYLGELDRAVHETGRSLEIHRSLGVKESTGLADSLFAHADVLEVLGRIAEAEQPARESLAMRESIYGGSHPKTGESLSLLAFILIKGGQLEEAESVSRRCYEIWKLRPEIEELWECPKMLATVYQSTGRLSEAIAVYDEELTTFRKIFGGSHPVIANCLDNYGVALSKAGRDDDAERLLLEALEMGRKYYKDQSPHEDHVLAELARIAGRRGDRAGQLGYSRESAEAGARTYPVGHRYWRESQRQFLETLLFQVYDLLSSKDSADAGQDVATLLTELVSFPKTHGIWSEGDTAWLEWLQAARERRNGGDAVTWTQAMEKLLAYPSGESGRKVHQQRISLAKSLDKILGLPQAGVITTGAGE